VNEDTCDSRSVGWKNDMRAHDENPVRVARVVRQDFTGVPILCDLAERVRNVTNDMRQRYQDASSRSSGHLVRRSIGERRINTAEQRVDLT